MELDYVAVCRKIVLNVFLHSRVIFCGNGVRAIMKQATSPFFVEFGILSTQDGTTLLHVQLSFEISEGRKLWMNQLTQVRLEKCH